MKLYRAYELLAKLRLLILAGQSSDGDLEFTGTMEQWQKIDQEESDILKDWDIYNS